jgi:methylated-DNA-[protein]-cysteine S-methyltransferase
MKKLKSWLEYQITMKFQDKVLGLVRKVPKGKVTTYKEIGKALCGKGQIYRAVGRALHDNKTPVIIPCHRVICSDGSLGGYSRGLNKKIELLKKEGIEIKNNKIDLKKYLHKF